MSSTEQKEFVEIDYNQPFNRHVIKYLMYRYYIDNCDEYPEDWNEYFMTIRRRFSQKLKDEKEYNRRSLSPPNFLEKSFIKK